MIHFSFGAEDVGRVRFAFSPLWETTASLRTLTAPAQNRLHAPWLERVRPRLADVDLDLLTALVRPVGYVPDFILPSAAGRASSFESELAQVAATSPAEVSAQLSYLLDHPVGQQRPGEGQRVRVARELIASPEAGLARITAELRRYWRTAIAPYWSRIRALLQADLAYRLEILASGGVLQLFRTLHPSVSFERDTLRVVKYYDGHVDLRQRGLLLVPCVFACPDVFVLTAEDHVPTVTYSPRGLGRLWEVQDTARRSPLAGVLGRSRAALLAQLDLPMSTTQLACQLDHAAPTLNAHLKTLQAAGLVSSRRDGRAVLYHRTKLGDLLLAGSGQG